VRIFDSRIEVQSPGRLPAHVTPKNILDERFARNGALVRLLNKFPDPPNRDAFPIHAAEGLRTARSKPKYRASSACSTAFRQHALQSLLGLCQ
jgi:ATP-dependent DNA helicase RecG